MILETINRIEPLQLEEPSSEISDVIAELSAATAVLGRALHSKTAANLADLVRIMNTYYSNLIEGHDTRPRDIERALIGEFDQDEGRRNLQLEAAAHVRVQAEIDRLCAQNMLPAPASAAFLQWLHREFYRDAPDSMLLIGAADRQFLMVPGAWRNLQEQDVAVGRHLPPSSDRVSDFMEHFASRFKFEQMGRADYGDCLGASPLQLYSSLFGRKWPRQPVDEPCHGQCRRNWRAWSMVCVTRAGVRIEQPHRLQTDDGLCRHAKAARQGRAGKSVGSCAEGLCALVFESLSGSGEFYVVAVRTQCIVTAAAALRRTAAAVEAGSGAPARRSSDARRIRARRYWPHHRPAGAHGAAGFKRGHRPWVAGIRNAKGQGVAEVSGTCA